MFRTVNWVIKASKLCNLRCRYCYEWNDLAKRDRIAPSQWDALLDNIHWYHRAKVDELGEPFVSNIIWHGGEPLLLPQEYFESVIALQRRKFADLPDGSVVNHLQTNLYSVPWATVDVLRDAGFLFGFSLDVASGVRLTAGGAETEHRVAQNFDMMRARGLRLGAIVVIAAHTHRNLREIYDFYESIRAPVKFLPLFSAPENGYRDAFGLGDLQLVAALQDLFAHWLERPQRIHVDPFVDYLQTLRSAYSKRGRPRFDRRRFGEWALIVNTDGTLYQVIDAYENDRALGNVFEDDIADILRSTQYRRSLDRDDVLRDAHCAGCTYEAACDQRPLFESRRDLRAGERCNIGYPVLEFMDHHLRQTRTTIDEVERILAGFRRLPATAAT